MNTVIIGAPLSGKTTCIQSLARFMKTALERRNLPTTDHPRGYERALGFVARRSGIERAFWTLPANVWAPDAWDQLVLEAQRVILVLDGHAVREGPNGAAVARLQSAVPFSRDGCVVLTKLDVVAVPEAWRQRDRLLRGTAQADWPTFVHTQKTSDLERARDLIPGWF
jgi:hypothetical protein